MSTGHMDYKKYKPHIRILDAFLGAFQAYMVQNSGRIHISMFIYTLLLK